jgi:hypothetical protein
MEQRWGGSIPQNGQEDSIDGQQEVLGSARINDI